MSDYPAMTYQQALMVVHNPRAYDRIQVKMAVCVILAKLDASEDDLNAAWAAA